MSQPSIIDVGTGDPLVLIPGIQGRWEYMGATVEALARSFRVLTFSLAGEPASGIQFDSPRGLDNYIAQVKDVLDSKQLQRAIICGVSFGGVIALAFAAEHPDYARALVLVSTPGPGWSLRRRHDWYARVPWLFGPLFLVETPLRLRREIAVALAPADRRRFGRRQLRTFLSAGISPTRMAIRARLIGAADLAAACERVTTPTLVVTGERELDRVVSVDHSSQYATRIRGAQAVVISRTGHIGCMTRPDAFAAAVADFVRGVEHAAA